MVSPRSLSCIILLDFGRNSVFIKSFWFLLTFRHPVETREEWVGRLSSWCEINFLWYCCTLTRWETPKECAVVVRNLVFPPFRNIITIVIGNNIQQTITQCAKVQKYEQHKIGLQFFDMWYKYYIKIIKIQHGCPIEGWLNRA